MFFGILSQLIFVEKPMKKQTFWILEISKITKILIFPWFFAKNGNFDESASWWSEKKIFRDGSGGPKNEFNTPLSNAAIKKYGRLMNFSHFWWFDFFHFLEAQKIPKIKCKIFNSFLQISSFFVIFHVFCVQNPFLLSKF